MAQVCIGFIIALAVFLLSFMVFRAQLSLSMAALYAMCGVAFMCVMAWVLGRDFPPGLLQNHVTLPWPLG